MRDAFRDRAYLPPSGKLNWHQTVGMIDIIGLDTLIEGSGGGEIDISLLQRYKTLPKPYDVRFLSVDAASGCRSGSYSVIQVWQMTDERLYLVHSDRGYWQFYDLEPT